jgi:hypothetical protein
MVRAMRAAHAAQFFHHCHHRMAPVPTADITTNSNTSALPRLLAAQTHKDTDNFLVTVN